VDVIVDPQVIEIGRSVLAVVGLVGGLGIGGYAAVKRARAVGEKTVSNEWRELAEVREEKITHLETKMVELETRLAHLEGAYAALQELKVTEIADRVVARLVESGLTRDGT
jgi:uncharacterized coiled-coil protein SlyX